MSATEIILALMGIAAVVLGGLAVLQAFGRRSARKVAEPLLDRVCPHCGGVFGRPAIREAREEHGFDLGDRCVSVVCPGCSRRFMFTGGELTEVRV
jgi:hypothetical protein